ncbi:bifunctional pyr operon transcriptional regulator/uracil phosphoribosyltransferase PyrR [Opitutus sp. ER46]|uniref:bifunctional pyr operon transcriptional regulator/uracil phosphoribosyltransferase PyrR n=1 Tax=Opitutus sp. ER46 TaxID=2161864 RepID=UPI000D2FA258|nr:bifunctional pyr operon transcriptional regulator/uracil phosphoribosyltransferase PyrR [Opitutus sp. ER46]PTY00346.1 bifunctional pyr operon transcriptional regulator/uracil phosphoribosyltransferase PyrR [Opitutus sp. ER46]
MAKLQTIGANEIHAAIEQLAAAISQQHARKPKLLLLGIANGGVELARRLAAAIGRHAPGRTVQAGVIDISFHRDDIARHPVPKEFVPTHIPADVHGATVILVDDVLFSGRTVKAALDELFDHGRPTKVELAVLVDRGARRLPIAADYTGLSLAVAESEKVVVKLDPANPQRDVLRIESAPLAAQQSAK